MGKKSNDGLISELVNAVCAFLWQASKEIYDKFSGRNRMKKGGRNKNNVDNDMNDMDGDNDEDGGIVGVAFGGVDKTDEAEKGLTFTSDEDDSDEYDDESSDDDDNVNDEVAVVTKKTQYDTKEKEKEQKDDSKKEDEKKEDEKKSDSDNDDDEDKIDYDSIQITEIYGPLWANERLIIELVNVLSSLGESSHHLSRINREWEGGNNLISCIGGVLNGLNGYNASNELKKMEYDSISIINC